MSDVVWGVNAADQIFWRDGPGGSWNNIPGLLKQVCNYTKYIILFIISYIKI